MGKQQGNDEFSVKAKALVEKMRGYDFSDDEIKDALRKLKKKSLSEPTLSSSSQEPTPSSEATTTSESVGEEPKNDLYADVEAAQSEEGYVEPVIEEPQITTESGEELLSIPKKEDIVKAQDLPAPDGKYKIDGKPVRRWEVKEVLFDKVDDVQSGEIDIEINDDQELMSLLEHQVNAGGQVGDKWESLEAGAFNVMSGVAGAQSYLADLAEEVTGIPFSQTSTAIISKESAKKLQEKAAESREKVRAYSGDFIESIASGDFAAAGNIAFNTTAESLPITLAAMATGGAGGGAGLGMHILRSAAVLTPTLTSAEYAAADLDPNQNDLSRAKKLLRSAIYGGAEAIGEGVTGYIGNASFGAFKSGLKSIVSKTTKEAGKEAGEKVARSIAEKSWKDIAKSIGVDMNLEGASEGMTQVIQDMTDDLMGVRDLKFSDYVHNFANAYGLGAAMGSIMGGSGKITGKAVSDITKLRNNDANISGKLADKVESGEITEEDAVRIEKDVEAVSKTNPKDTEEKRAKDANLIKRKEELESEVEAMDKDIAEASPQKKELNEVKAKLSGETETKETPVKEDIEKKYEDLTLDEKLELQDIAIDQMENEMAEQGIKEYELTNEMVDERASQILQQDIDNLERSLEGETRFRLDNQTDESLINAEGGDVEAIANEMDAMNEEEQMFTAPKVSSKTQVAPINDSKSTQEFTQADAQSLGFESIEQMEGTIEEFDGIPMVTGISDLLGSGTYTDSKGNPMELNGGLGFNSRGKNKNAAWAGVGVDKSESQVKAAVDNYKKNTDLFDRLWAEGKLPNGHVPMAIIRMGNDAVNSNEAVFRWMAPEIKSQPKENQTSAMNALITRLEAQTKTKQGDKATNILNQIKDNKVKTLGQLMDLISKQAKERAQGNKSTMSLDERGMIFTNLVSGEGTKKNGKPTIKALYEGAKKNNSNIFTADNIYSAIGEPSMLKSNKGDVVAIMGIDVRNGGEVINIDHENYGTGPKGRLIKLIKNPTNGIDVFPTWRAKTNRIFKKDKSGKLPNQQVVASQTMGTAAADQAFQMDKVTTGGMSDIDLLSAKLRFAFPMVSVSNTTQQFNSIINQEGVRTKVSKGKTILGMTKDGKVFLNPDQASLGTPIHEFGHIWIDFLRSKSSGIKGTRLLKRGLKLVEGTPELKAAIEKYGDNKLAREEALVEMMANKGETIINAAKKSRFKEWMNAIFKYIKEKFTTLEGLKTKEIESMSLEDFINTGLADLFAGKAVDAKSKIKFDAAKESQGVMPRFSLGDDVAAFIKDARGQGISEVAIKTVLNRRGVSIPDIKAAFEKAGPKAKQEVQAKPDVVDTKSEKEAPIEKEESPRLEIDLDESTKSWVPKKLNSALEGIRVGLQDRWYRLRKTIRLARKAGAVISDEIDAYTKRELQSGKVSEKVTKFKELIIKSKPNQKNALLEDMQEDGVTNLDEFGLFLYAQHAPERNQTLKDRAVEEGREDTEGLSGMTNEQAQEIIESMPKDKLAKYKEYAKRFREEVILPSIDELENSELINSELANTLRTKWKNYVPLMVEEFVSDKAKYPSPKFSVRGKDIYKAKGSNFYDNKSRVNPFISGIERYINYASRAEENRTFQSLVGLAEKINNPDILKVIRPKYEPVRDTDGNTVYVRRKFENEAGKNLVEGKIDGKPVLIEVVNKNLFDALENSTISLNKVEQVLNAVNSYLRAVNTLMNPEFIVRNFVRDIQTAFINISAEDAKGMAAQMVKNVPSAIRGIIDNQRGNETEWSKIYQELKDEGGDVSWLEANDLTKIKKDIDASIKRYDKSSTKRNLIRALESIGGGWNTSMKATEMATRVAAYKTAIDKGYSKQKAASLAKNLTVNFEKKGVYGNLINSLYLFANAGIQGSAVIFKAMSKKGVGGNRARALAGSIIGMSFLNAMINDWVDDDDEVDKLTEVDKERNMIFMLPNKERVTIPLPYGYNLLWVTGQLSYDMASGNKTAGDAMASFLRAFDGAFNPLSSGNLGQMFTPTIAKPFVQAATNRNYKDAPIKPEDRPFSPKLKESSKFFKTARGSSKAVTDYLNKVSGGTEVVSGKVDISPEIIDHYIDFLGGGLGRFVANSVDIPYKIATGEDISTNNIPFARIFYRTPSSGRDLQVIYRTIEDSYKTKYTDRQKQKFFNSLNSALEEQVITVDEYERFLDDFNKAEMIKSISESNPDLMLEDIKEILKD